VKRVLGGALLLALGAGAILFVEALLARRGPDAPFANPSAAPMRFGAPGDPELRLVVLGDSTGAGQGAPYADGIAVYAARLLTERQGGRHVTLVNLSESGATTAEVRRDQLARAMAVRPDVALVASGANDVTSLRRADAVVDDLRAIVRGLRRSSPGVRIVLTGSPDVGSSPRLAQPLRAVAGARTRQVNAAIREWVAGEDLAFAPIAARTGPQFRRDRTLFSSDRYHPNARGYATWRAPLREAFARALADGGERGDVPDLAAAARAAQRP